MNTEGMTVERVEAALAVERLTDPEPTEPGTVVMDRCGFIAIRDDDDPSEPAWRLLSGPGLDERYDSHVSWSNMDDPRPVIRDER